ncbi:MAG TPA: hemerythrin domain-containing protein [Burkholderiales bacterium]
MELQRQISRKLHEEHVAILDLLDRFGRALARLGATPPAPDDPTWRLLLAQIGAALEYEITRHFDLEETQLFPRLHARGEGDLAELLFEDHEAIRAVARPLLLMVARAQAGVLEDAAWRSLKAAGLELVERLSAHAEKEQGALVPLVDEMLDEAADEELWTNYVR